MPCAFVELKDGATLEREELAAHCRKFLAGFKVPKNLVFGALPKTSTGKIQKFLLRQQAKSASAIDCEPRISSTQAEDKDHVT